jgi:cyclin H
MATFWNIDPDRIEKWITDKDSRRTWRKDEEDAKSMLKLEEIKKILKMIVDEIERQNSKGIDMNAVREVDRRLKFCTNPEKDPQSAL